VPLPKAGIDVEESAPRFTAEAGDLVTLIAASDTRERLAKGLELEKRAY
jgi:hypothetical protein